MSLDLYLTVGACSHCGRSGEPVWDRNITYNLSTMWRAAGVPFSDEGIEGKRAADVLPALEASLVELRAKPVVYRAMNPANGWGVYEELVDLVGSMLDAARKHPESIVGTWR